MPNNEIATGKTYGSSYEAELITPKAFPELDPASRISALSLIDQTSPNIRFGQEPSLHDFRHSAVSYLNSGLYVPTDEASRAGKDVEHIIEIGAKRDVSQPREDKVKSRFGVAFQPVEFKVLARSAPDLGRHLVVKTLEARRNHEDRSQRRDASKRAAGHGLQTKIAAMDSLSLDLSANNRVLYHLAEHLLHPDKIRVRLGRLEHELGLGVEKIHDTAEVASIYLGLDNLSTNGLHRAIKKHIWSGNYSSQERGAFLFEYLKMVGVHNLAKKHKVELAKHKAKQELATKYQTYLDAEESRKANEQLRMSV
jgi:hypothetical protein